MNLWSAVEGALGIVGTVVSIIALLKDTPAQRRITHVIYLVAVVLSTAVAFGSYQKLSRIERIERAASEMVRNADSYSSHKGFILAALAFLEKIQDVHPYAYASARELCPINNCLSNKDAPVLHIAHDLRDLLHGIATINKSP